MAEDGKPATLGTYAAMSSGITYPASPGAWLLHQACTKPLFNGIAKDAKGIVISRPSGSFLTAAVAA